MQTQFQSVNNQRHVFIVAEIGANHNGKLSTAKDLIHAAAECKVDAVKFQTYTAEELVADIGREVVWGPAGKKCKETIGNLFDRLSLAKEYHKELFTLAQECGLVFFSTPFSIEGVNFLETLDIPIYKIASSDVTFDDLLISIAKTHKSVFLSTGKSLLSEIDHAVHCLKKHGSSNITLLHCVASYPALTENMNLLIINTLKERYPDISIGISDHSDNNIASLGAVALGATVVEKHFTLNKNDIGPDHWFSTDIKMMKQLVKDIRELEKAMGSGNKTILDCEKEGRKYDTRSIVLANDLMNNIPITKKDLKIVRPGWGIHPYDISKVLGRCLSKPLQKNTILTWDLLNE